MTCAVPILCHRTSNDVPVRVQARPLRASHLAAGSLATIMLANKGGTFLTLSFHFRRLVLVTLVAHKTVLIYVLTDDVSCMRMM